MPWGSRPSMAALTKSGARKASEIVMLIFRTLQFSRVAMLSALAVGTAKIAHIYYECEPGRRSAAKLLTKDEARRIAVNFAKLPGLLLHNRERPGEEI